MNRKTVKIDDNVNFTYHYWMRKYFNLEGVELTVYAIVYNVSCIQDSRLYAGAKYIAELIGSSERTVYRALSSLCEKNLIIKNIEELKGMERTSYTTNIDKIVEMRSKSVNTAKMSVPLPNETKNRENTSQSNCQNGSSPTVKMTDNNHSNNNQNILNSEINLNSSSSKISDNKEKENIYETIVSPIFSKDSKKKRFEKSAKEEHQFNVRQYFPGDEDKIPF